MKSSTLLVTLFFLTSVICAQDSLRMIDQKSVGILVEYGSPYYCLPEGSRYYVVNTGAMVSFPLFKGKKRFNLSLDLFPHYGFIWLDSCNDYFEVGVNLRLSANFSLSPDDVLRLMLASGPQYISVQTEKQAKGFSFSDYYLLAYDRRISVKRMHYGLRFEFGYRHVSNAGLKEPNRSISNFIFGLGILYVW